MHVNSNQPIRAKIPAEGQKRTREHQVSRLQFVRDHRDRTNKDWANILFTNECRYCLISSDRRLVVHRRDYYEHSLSATSRKSHDGVGGS